MSDFVVSILPFDGLAQLDVTTSADTVMTLGRTLEIWDLFHEQFLHHNSNSMETSFCSHPTCGEVITMQFCTWHDSYAVMACAKFYSDMIPYNGITLKQFSIKFELRWKSCSWNGPQHFMLTCVYQVWRLIEIQLQVYVSWKEARRGNV